MTWYNELRVFKELGLDRVALAASDACKRCLRDEKNTWARICPETRLSIWLISWLFTRVSFFLNIIRDNDLQYADSVSQSYEELTAELKEFQERVKQNQKESKSVYQSPGKYEHLMQ